MEDFQGLAARYDSIMGFDAFAFGADATSESSTLSGIANRLSAKTSCNFEVQYQGSEEVIKCTNPNKAMRLLADLQKAGFNALLTVRQQDIGLEITIKETAEDYYFPRSTSIKNALRNFEQGKTQPENMVAHASAKNAALEFQKSQASFN